MKTLTLVKGEENIEVLGWLKKIKRPCDSRVDKLMGKKIGCYQMLVVNGYIVGCPSARPTPEPVSSSSLVSFHFNQVIPPGNACPHNEQGKQSHKQRATSKQKQTLQVFFRPQERGNPGSVLVPQHTSLFFLFATLLRSF